MSHIGNLIAKAHATSTAVPESIVEAPKARLYRVSLCVMFFAEIEATEFSPEEAEAYALRNVRLARRKFKTAPAAHRVEMRCLVDPKDPEKGFKWVEVHRP